MKISLVHIQQHRFSNPHIPCAIDEPAHLLGIKRSFEQGRKNRVLIHDFPVKAGMTFGKAFAALGKEIILADPGVVAFSYYYEQDETLVDKKALFDLARECRSVTVLGGPEATYDTRESVERYSPTFLVVGKGEVPASVLAENDFDPQKVRNSSVFAGEIDRTIILRAEKSPKNLLNSLPTDRPYSLSEYLFEAMIRTNSGCVGSCSFCPHDHEILIREPSLVLEEFRYLRREQNVTGFTYIGRDFTTHPGQANAIVAGLNRMEELSGTRLTLEVGLPTVWKAWSRANKDWERLSSHFRLELNVGLESTLAERRLRLGKSRTLEASIRQSKYLESLLEHRPGTNPLVVFAQLIPFDPDSTAEEVVADLENVYALMGKYFPRFIPVAGSLNNRLDIFPGTLVEDMYGGIDATNLFKYFRKDKRVAVIYGFIEQSWRMVDHLALEKKILTNEEWVSFYMEILKGYIATAKGLAAVTTLKKSV
ncbi:MAG: hypothetical protein WCV91_04005 [Candidatus Margulisiibacteriota bacterium]